MGSSFTDRLQLNAVLNAVLMATDGSPAIVLVQFFSNFRSTKFHDSMSLNDRFRVNRIGLALNMVIYH